VSLGADGLIPKPDSLHQGMVVVERLLDALAARADDGL
jgi:hypothetical protein